MTLRHSLIEQTRLLMAAATLDDTIWAMADAYAHALQSGRTLLFCGNGGSMAEAQHLATEYVVRFRANRPALAAYALGTDPTTLTAAGNDLGFETVFERQIDAIGRPGDVLTCLTTSGASPNVVRAANRARFAGLTVVAITGHAGFQGHADHCLALPSRNTAHIQVVSLAVGHALVEQVEVMLGHEEAA